MRVEDVIDRYIRSAKAHGEATASGDHKRANASYEAIIEVVRVIRAEGWESKLVKLIADPDVNVKLWAATHALEIDEKQAIATLKELSTGDGVSAFSAQMVLEQWSKGELVIPK